MALKAPDGSRDVRRRSIWTNANNLFTDCYIIIFSLLVRPRVRMLKKMFLFLVDEHSTALPFKGGFFSISLKPDQD